MDSVSASPVRRLPIGVDVTLGDGAGGHRGVQGQRGRRGRGRPIHMRGRVDVRVRAGLLDAHLKAGTFSMTSPQGAPKF